MYVSIGNNCMVRKSDILGIFDLDNATWSKWTRKALNMAEQAGAVVNAALDEIPNSFVLCAQAGRQTIYLSALTAATLARRAEKTIV